MFETTQDFFADAINCKLVSPIMPDILRSMTGLDDLLPFGTAVHEFHKLAPRERNYICCVLLERDQDMEAWQTEWNKFEQEAFE